MTHSKSIYTITHYDTIFEEIQYHMIAHQKFKEKKRKWQGSHGKSDQGFTEEYKSPISRGGSVARAAQPEKNNLKLSQQTGILGGSAFDQNTQNDRGTQVAAGIRKFPQQADAKRNESFDRAKSELNSTMNDAVEEALIKDDVALFANLNLTAQQIEDFIY